MPRGFYILRRWIGYHGGWIYDHRTEIYHNLEIQADDIDSGFVDDSMDTKGVLEELGER
jgi:hypothetical protein